MPYERGLYECPPCLRFDHQTVHGPILFCLSEGADEISMNTEQVLDTMIWANMRRASL